MNATADTPRNLLQVVDLGTTAYEEAWEIQRRVFDLRSAGTLPDVLLLNEHRHVYTLGKSSDDDHLLASPEELAGSGVGLFRIDRGGDVTYHGPGQLVGYPIIDLNNYYLDLHRYLRDLEEMIIRTLAKYGVEGRREAGFTGVWVGSEKIAAIGVRVSRWVTMHGFAFNINTDLSYFDRIIPCGIFHKGVTSLERVLGRSVPVAEVSAILITQFASVFGCHALTCPRQEFLQSLQSNTTVACHQ